MKPKERSEFFRRFGLEEPPPYDGFSKVLIGALFVILLLNYAGGEGDRWWLYWLEIAWVVGFAAFIVLFCKELAARHPRSEAVRVTSFIFLSNAFIALLFSSQRDWLFWAIFGAFAGAMALVIFDAATKQDS
jgi:hypothetical protein